MTYTFNNTSSIPSMEEKLYPVAPVPLNSKEALQPVVILQKKNTKNTKPRKPFNQYELGKTCNTKSRRLALLEYMQDNMNHESQVWVFMKDLIRFYVVDLHYKSHTRSFLINDIDILIEENYIEILSIEGKGKTQSLLVKFTNKVIPDEVKETYIPRCWRNIQNQYHLTEMELIVLVEINNRPHSFSYPAFKKKWKSADQEFNRVVKKLEYHNLLSRVHIDEEILFSTQFKMNLPKI